jgi:hypothetical protein
MNLCIKYIKDSGIDDYRKPNDNSIENRLMKNSLEFLKTTSLIKFRLYSKEIPWIVSD